MAERRPEPASAATRARRRVRRRDVRAAQPRRRRARSSSRRAPESTAADVAAAVAAAVDGLARVAARRHRRRRAEVLSRAARLLAERADDIAAEMVAEEGKPLADARNEAIAHAEEPRALRRRGVPADRRDVPERRHAARLLACSTRSASSAVITPWNFPLNLASRKIGPALAAGNTVVFKPSPMTPLMGDRLAAAFVDAGLPAGVLNVVHGFGAGAHLVADERRRRAITFTGSTATGRKIHAAVRLGQRAAARARRQEPDRRARRRRPRRRRRRRRPLVSSRLSGQACTGAGRILVERGGPRRARRRASSPAPARHVLGPGDAAGVTMGPLIDERAVDGDGRAVVADGERRDGADARRAAAPPRRRRRSPTAGSSRRPCSPTSSPARRWPTRRGVRTGDRRSSGSPRSTRRSPSANAVEYGLSAAICTPFARRRPALRRRDPGRHGAGQPADRRRRVQRAVRWHQAVGHGTHREQLGPTVMDFYTVQPHGVAGH